ncbi:3'-5' exonuclease [Acetobacter conturbans]|uniref:Exonuclease domain-containing protein n=1 Tax=Acetobacter conturbans TaxID=1737472 RepID=A0ABX0K153_9PROT|nr:3'-5' exonuclease [Acetobacter conturbans]NHN89461.1 hypothetical protein [Acetobacter conturbans]
MRFTAEELLSYLLETTPCSTFQAPRDSRGLYGLVDHHGDLRYIGSTSSTDQTLYERIHRRHRTGSEGMSHYFSQMYNTGRMWRDRKNPITKTDGDIAKTLRNEFIVDHCRAVWLQLPDTLDIAALEAEVLSLAPSHAISWNRRGMLPYDEPVHLVEATLSRLRWGTRERDAIERQRERFLATVTDRVAAPILTTATAGQIHVTPFPRGPFRFFALDVETATHDRGSICQIGIACVRPDNSIEIWATYVDPKVDRWVFTYLHGISARMVRGAPTFSDVLPVLRDALKGATVYQHSSFDRSAIAAACGKCGQPVPEWNWRDSVHVARAAWPELKGNDGHGLASLKQHLGLVFEHHHAGEDARAAAEVVLRAEEVRPAFVQRPTQAKQIQSVNSGDLDLREDRGNLGTKVLRTVIAQTSQTPAPHKHLSHHIGTTELTQGNIDNNHIYLNSFFDKFPADVIGGSNRASAALREIAVDWGDDAVVTTDLDGTKRFFRKRGWIRKFFEQESAQAGDIVVIEEIEPYRYRVVLKRRLS